MASKKRKTKAGADVPIRGNRCYRCGHEWRPRDFSLRARACPKCKSPYWELPRNKRG